MNCVWNVKEERFSTVENRNNVVIASGRDTRVVAEAAISF